MGREGLRQSAATAKPWTRWRGGLAVRLTWDGKRDGPPAAAPGLRLAPVEDVHPNPAGGGRPPPLDGAAFPGRLVHGDNLAAMQALAAQGLAGQVDLAYADPPYLSQVDRAHVVALPEGAELERLAYRDTWPGGLESYLAMLHPRLVLARDLLSERGSLVVHADWRAASHVRLLLDEVFGPDRVQGALVWSKGVRGTRTQRGFQRAHDQLWWCTKTDAWAWNQSFEPYRDPALRRYNQVDEAGRRFALVRRRKPDGTVYYGRTYPGEEGKWRSDVLADVPSLSATASERVGFATQKPEALLEVLVRTLSDPGGLVLDPFCGSGTTLAVAERLGRRWVGIDASPVAAQVTRTRLVRQAARPFRVERVEGGGDGGESGDWAPAEAGGPRPTLRLAPPEATPLGGGEHLVAVTLAGYTPARPTHGLHGLGEGGRFAVLLDHWDVDWAHDGRTFRSLWQAVRGNGPAAATVGVRATAVLPAGRLHRVAVRAVDMFGGEATAAVDVDLREAAAHPQDCPLPASDA